MNSNPTPRSRPNWLIRSTVALLTLLLVACAVILYARNRLEMQVEAELQAIRDMGIPTTREALFADRGKPEPGPNAAPIYLHSATMVSEFRAFDDTDWGLLPISGNTIIPPGGVIEPAVRDACNRVIERNAEFLQEIDNALAIPYCHFDLDPSRASETAYVAFTPANEAVKLLTTRAMTRAAEGDMEGAIDDVSRLLGLADHCRGQPTEAAAYAELGAVRHTIIALEDALCRGSVDAPLLAPLQKRLALLSRNSPIPVAAKHQFVDGLRYFDDPTDFFYGGYVHSSSSFSWEDMASETMVMAYKAFGLAEADRLGFVKRCRSTFEMLSLDESVQWAETKKEEARIGAASEPMLLTSHLGPSPESMVGLHLVCRVQLRCAAVALAVERYRAQTGSLPETLVELEPTWMDELPNDPFTLQPLHYRITETGFRVYSVGRDGTDSGGVDSLNAFHTFSEPDIVFRVECPPSEVERADRSFSMFEPN